MPVCVSRVVNLIDGSVITYFVAGYDYAPAGYYSCQSDTDARFREATMCSSQDNCVVRAYGTITVEYRGRTYSVPLSPYSQSSCIAGTLVWKLELREALAKADAEKAPFYTNQPTQEPEAD